MAIQSVPVSSTVAVQTEPVIIIDQPVIVHVGSDQEQLVHPEAMALIPDKPVSITWPKQNISPVKKNKLASTSHLTSEEYRLHKNRRQRILRRISPQWRKMLQIKRNHSKVGRFLLRRIYAERREGHACSSSGLNDRSSGAL